MLEPYSNKILQTQLAALHDIAHDRTQPGAPDEPAKGLCPDCNNGHLCAIHELSEILLKMNDPDESDYMWAPENLNGYIKTPKHPPYKPELLEKQLNLVCAYRKTKNFCAGCGNCPILRVQALMQICEKDTTSVPANTWLDTTPDTLRLAIAFDENELTLSAEIRIPNGLEDSDAWNEAYQWRDKFVKQHADITENTSQTGEDAITVDCTGTNRKKFVIIIPGIQTESIDEYVTNIMNIYFKNIKSWKVRKN